MHAINVKIHVNIKNFKLIPIKIVILMKRSKIDFLTDLSHHTRYTFHIT